MLTGGKGVFRTPFKEEQGDEQLQIVPAEGNADEDEACEEDGEEDGKLKRCGAKVRVRHSIYQKLQVIRELDRLLEEGQKHGLEKKIMQTFPHIFMGTRGSLKSGMLGRWLVQCDEQKWREIPFERMNEEDRNMKELPDWIRVAFGMVPRGLERFKEGSNVPPVISKAVISMVERITCGGDNSRQTCGTLDVKDVKLEAERLLKVYHEAQEKEAEERGLEAPAQKSEVSIRWVNRILEHYGWKRNAPNTHGAYLDYEDERMKKSRKCWEFLRLGNVLLLWGAESFHYIHLHYSTYI